MIYSKNTQKNPWIWSKPTYKMPRNPSYEHLDDCYVTNLRQVPKNYHKIEFYLYKNDVLNLRSRIYLRVANRRCTTKLRRKYDRRNRDVAFFFSLIVLCFVFLTKRCWLSFLICIYKASKGGLNFYKLLWHPHNFPNFIIRSAYELFNYLT